MCVSVSTPYGSSLTFYMVVVQLSCVSATNPMKPLESQTSPVSALASANATNLLLLPMPISMGVWLVLHKENSLFLISLIFLFSLLSLSLFPSPYSRYANDKHPFIRRGIRISNAIC